MTKQKKEDGTSRVAAAAAVTALPTVDDLKKKFKAGTVPLETDFENLIDIAEYGRKAVGQSPEQADSAGPGKGLELDTGTGRLSVKVRSAGGVEIDEGGLYLVHPQGPTGEPGSSDLPPATVAFIDDKHPHDGWKRILPLEATMEKRNGAVVVEITKDGYYIGIRDENGQNKNVGIGYLYRKQAD